MKINLQCAKNFRKDFINVDNRPHFIQKLPPDSNFCPGGPDNIDHICPKNDADVISFGDRLEVFRPEEIMQRVTYWLTKLKPTGELQLLFVDSGEFASNFLKNPMKPEEVNYILFGEPGFEIRCMLDTQTVTQMAIGLGLKVKKCQKITPFLIKMTFVRKNDE